MVAGSSYAPSHRAGAVLGLLLFLTGISDAVAKRGDLDPSFGAGGRLFVNFTPFASARLNQLRGWLVVRRIHVLWHVPLADEPGG